MAELLGYSVEEMQGRPLFDFMFESDIEEKKSEMERRRRGVSEQIETRYRKKNGEALWARVTTSPILGVDGSFEGALAMVSDRSEQMRAESERRRSQEMISLLSRAVEQTADSIVITDRQGTIEYVNPAFEVITGYSRLEVVGKTPSVLKSSLHDRAFYNRLWGQILQGDDFRGTLVDRKKSGELYWVEQTISPIKDSAGVISHYVSVCKDITVLRKEQERELQLQMARNVQQRFYTGAATGAAGLDIACAIYPDKEACGDYLDAFTMHRRRERARPGFRAGDGANPRLCALLRPGRGGFGEDPEPRQPYAACRPGGGPLRHHAAGLPGWSEWQPVVCQRGARSGISDERLRRDRSCAGKFRPTAGSFYGYQLCHHDSSFGLAASPGSVDGRHDGDGNSGG
jgi:PAS domain S-box-containing protein